MADNNLKDKTVKGLIWGGLNNGIMQVMNLAFGIVIAALLTPDDYGLAAMLTVFSAVAGAIQESGFLSALINRHNASHRDYNSVFWFNITCSALIYAILWFAAPLIAAYNNEPRLIPLARYAFTGFFIVSFSIVPRAILMKQIKAKQLALTTMTATLTAGIVGASMAYCGMAYWGIVTQNIAYVGVVSIMSLAYARFRPTLDFSLTPIRQMFGFSSRMLITNIFNCINNNAFNLLLGGFFPAKDVGYYSQANNWNQKGGYFISGMVQGVAQPMFVAMDNDTERLRRSFRKMLRFTSFVAFPVMFGLALIAPELIVVTVKEKWLPSAELMRILCVGGAFGPIAVLYYNFIISRGKSGVYMWNIICQGLLTIAMLLCVSVCRPSFMGVGGIKLMVVLYVLICIAWLFIWHYFLWKEIQLSLLKAVTDVVPFMLLAGATMAATYALTSGISSPLTLLLCRIPTAAAIYIAALRLLKANILMEAIGYMKKKRHKA